MFFDTAVNGYYTLTILKKEFTAHLPLIPAQEKIAEDVAPFIFEIEPEKMKEFSALNNILVKEIILLDSTSSLQDIQNHFSQFVVQTIKDRQFYFRFWSDKVFKKFIASSNPQQVKEFFGPVQLFVCEDDNPSCALVFSFQAARLVTEKIGTDTIFSLVKKYRTSTTMLSNKIDSATNQVTVELKAQRPARRFFD